MSGTADGGTPKCKCCDGWLRAARWSAPTGGGGFWYNIGMDKLYRSSDEKVVAGVCAGLAHKLDLNANGLRCVVVLVTIFMTGIPLFVYAALWMILKERPTGGGVIDV